MDLPNDIPHSLSTPSKKHPKSQPKLAAPGFAFLLAFGLLSLGVATQAQDTKRVDVAARAESSTPRAKNNSSSNHSGSGFAVLKKIGWLPSKIRKGLATVFSDDNENASTRNNTDSRELSLCELLDNWQTYHRQKIRVRGIYQVGAEQAWFYDPGCKNWGTPIDVRFREHVHGAAKQLDRIIAGNKSARVTFEGVFYASRPSDKSVERYGRGGYFHTMIKVKTVANPIETTGQPAETISKAEGNQQQDLREQVRSTIALSFPSRAHETRATLKGLGTSAVPFIAEAIRSDSMNPIKAAFLIDVIADIGGEESDRALITLLSHPAPDVRGFAAIELGNRKATIAIPHLIGLLNDIAVYETIVSTHPSSEQPVLVRDAAINSLQAITGMILSPAGSKKEQAEDWIRWWQEHKPRI